MHRRFLILSFAILASATILFGQQNATKSITPQTVSIIDSLISVSKTFIGKPYRFTNKLGRQMDCSGFVSYVFSLFEIQLPKSSKLMADKVIRLTMSEVRRGDLLFFKGRSRKSRQVGHVGIVVDKDGDQIIMLHSCRRGIIIENYTNYNYYKDRFLFAGRIPELITDDCISSLHSADTLSDMDTTCNY